MLLLDEAKSHLDVWNERAVNAAIWHIAMTCILIAPRPEITATADRVVVRKRGRVARDDDLRGKRVTVADDPGAS